MMKRFIALIMTLCVVFTLSVPACAVSSNASLVGQITEPALHLGYMEFYENQDYYMDLVIKEDYCLYIDVDEEYRDLELDRITEDAKSIQELTPASNTRGVNQPTTGWNINTQGTYTFSVSTASTPIYTNYYFTGANTYVLTMTNVSNIVPSGGYAYNTVSGPAIFSGGTGTVIKKFAATSTTAHFYVCFNAPTYIVGSIKKY